MKYDNLRLCNDYIADMEGQLDAIAKALGVKRGEPAALVAAAERVGSYAEELRGLLRDCLPWLRSPHGYGTAHHFSSERMRGLVEAALAKNNGGLPTSGRKANGNVEVAQTDAARNPRAGLPGNGAEASDGGVITTRPAATNESQVAATHREVESSTPSTTLSVGVARNNSQEK